LGRPAVARVGDRFCLRRLEPSAFIAADTAKWLDLVEKTKMKGN
jgi:hypothetical protein